MCSECRPSSALECVTAFFNCFFLSYVFLFIIIIIIIIII
jgi:hypothetical protein